MRNTEKTRLSFIGVGNIAGQHLNYLKEFPDVEIAGFYDSDKHISRKRREQFGGTDYSSIEKMLDKSKSHAVYICLPPYSHGEAEMACIERHIPFFVEKPLSNDIETAKRLSCEVRNARIITCTGYMNRYRKGIQKAKRQLDKYPIVLIIGGWIVNSPECHPWLTRKRLSGGQLIEQTTHLFDLMRYLCGEASSVHCYGFNRYIQPRNDYDVDDANVTSIKLKSGLLASIQSSWSVGFEEDIYMKLLGHDIRVEFTGWNFNAKIRSNDNPVPLEIPGEKNIFAIENRAFLDAVKSNDPSGILSDYEDGVRSLELSFAAVKSLETDSRVELDDYGIQA